LILDKSINDSEVRELIFKKISEEQIRTAVEKVFRLARAGDDKYFKEFVGRYRRVRVFLPYLLKTVEFRATPSGLPILKALSFLKTIEGQYKPDMSKAPFEIISKTWRRLLIDENGHIGRQAYTLCVLQQLQDGLRRRDVFVPDSDRWSDPRKKLLRGSVWNSKRSQVCRSLSLPKSAHIALENLEEQLNVAYRKTIENIPNNQDVRIEVVNGKTDLVLTGLEKLDESPSLVELRENIAKLLPRVDLPDLILEIHEQTGFTDEFKHISEGNARVVDLPISICAVLIAEACNIGFEPLIQSDHPALTRNRLSWVQQNFIRAETLTKANACLVDHQASIPLVQIWGGGDVASADGLRFVTPIRTINSGPNPKYFGYSRGITYYNFTSDQFTGFHGIVIPGTLRDSIYILEGLLEQQTSLRPTEIMADTSGVSDIIFGLFWLLGYRFSPRLADIGSSRFWRIDPKADYGVLNQFANHQIKHDRIVRHWDDLLRLAGSLKLGTVSASELIKSLLKSDRPSGLSLALANLGRIPKTIYLLNYIDDQVYRRRILNQLNRGERRHSVARIICHGRRGEIRKRYREGQEDQLGALGLVTNAVVLWNTIYTEAALNQLEFDGYSVKKHDIPHVSPLQYKHINVMGRYSFAMAESVAKGKLRPLNIQDDDYSILNNRSSE
jgi:TnpA family transposase